MADESKFYLCDGKDECCNSSVNCQDKCFFTTNKKHSKDRKEYTFQEFENKYYEILKEINMKQIKNVKDVSVHEGKIVRDRIPELIENEGRVAYIRVVQGNELKQRLSAKLLEEAYEVVDSTSKKDITEELVDVLDVVDALISAYDIDKDELNSVRRDKKNAKGNFSKGYLLISEFLVDDEEPDQAEKKK